MRGNAANIVPVYLPHTRPIRPCRATFSLRAKSRLRQLRSDYRACGRSPSEEGLGFFARLAAVFMQLSDGINIQYQHGEQCHG